MPTMSPTSAAPGLDDDDGRQFRLVSAWLFVIAAMIFAMIVLGGVTRLTHSGLSMVEWKPVTGWLPPPDYDSWERIFAKYRTSSEYRVFNQGMTLGEFKSIFWLEFLHRLWGRIIGVAFLLPFLAFLAMRWISRGLAVRLLVIFMLGGLQGTLGWFMVKSGLGDRPDVSQYRLTAHFGLGLALFGYVLWVALGILRNAIEAAPVRHARTADGLLGLVFVTTLSGALVAGLDAGLAYNTFPFMDGDWIPEGVFDLSPTYLNLFENIATVQFEHRVLAVTTLASVLLFWVAVGRVATTSGVRCATGAMAAMAIAQVGLGIGTLLLFVPVALASLHQAGAVVLFGLTVWVVYEFRFPGWTVVFSRRVRSSGLRVAVQTLTSPLIEGRHGCR